MKNSEQPAFSVTYDTVRATDLTSEQSLGLTKREYFAAQYASIAPKIFEEALGSKLILRIAEISDGSEYRGEKHYLKAIVKIQLLLADELLKQLEETK